MVGRLMAVEGAGAVHELQPCHSPSALEATALQDQDARFVDHSSGHCLTTGDWQLRVDCTGDAGTTMASQADASPQPAPATALGTRKPGESETVVVDGAYLTLNRSDERRARSLAKAKAYGAAVGGAICGYFAGTSIAMMSMGDFAGAELVAPRIRLGRFGWMPRANLVTVASIIVFSAAGVAFVHPQHMTDPVLWPTAAATLAVSAYQSLESKLLAINQNMATPRISTSGSPAALPPASERR